MGTEIREEVAQAQASTLRCICCGERMVVEVIDRLNPLYSVTLTHGEGISVGYGITVELAYREAHIAKAFVELEEIRDKMQ